MSIPVVTATKLPKKPPTQSPIDVPTRMDSSTSSGLILTVRLITTGFSTWFSICWQAMNAVAVTMPAVSEWPRGEQDRGDAGQRAADHGQEIHQRHPHRPQQRWELPGWRA